MLAAGERLAHLPELETDLGTVVKLLVSMNILIQNNCSFFQYLPCHVTPNQQHIVLVNWTNVTQLFVVYFSASSISYEY